MKQGWTYKKLGEVATFHRGLTYSKEDEAPLSSKCVLRSNNIDLETGRLNLSELKYLREDFDIPQDKLLKSDSIFICMSNGSKQHVGKVAYIKEDSYYAFGGFMGLIIPLKTSIFPKFLYYFFLSSEYRSLLLSVGNGIGITNLKFSDLSTFPIPVPPLSVQQSIVSELDMLSGLIAKHEEQLKAYDELAQSIFYDMFGDPVENEKGWEVKKLGEVCTTSSGGTPSTQHKEYYEGGTIPWLRSGEVSQGFISSTEFFITELGMNNSSAKYFPINTVVVAMYGATVGQVGVLQKEMTTNQAVCGILPTSELCPTYLYFFLMAMKPFYLKNAAGGAQPNISQGVIKNTRLALPPLSLQSLFAEKIEAIERQKERIRQSMAEVKTLFDSRMDYYFNSDTPLL